MIRKAIYQDLDVILDIYKTARTLMKKSGNPKQWGEDYPPVSLIEADIRQEQLYICKENDVIYGVFAFIIGEDPDYIKIEQGTWLNGKPYGAIHRVAGDGSVKGVFYQCVNFCKQQISDLRIDTHHDNIIMQHVIEKEGFVKCGVIYVEDGSARIAYQYSAENDLNVKNQNDNLYGRSSMEAMTCICTEDCALGFNPNCECTCGECSCKNLANMIGVRREQVFHSICEFLDSNYNMDKVWKRQKVKTKKWKYEYKYSKSGKTLCGFYITDDCLGFMIILGKKEQALVEEDRADYSIELLHFYDNTVAYHDGKWLMLELDDMSLIEDIKKLLLIKRKRDR